MALAEDFMDRLAATEYDPNAFSELVFGTPLHDGQLRYHEEHNGQVNFLLPGNSWGKTEFITRYSLWEAWFKKGYDFPQNDSYFELWYQAKWEGLIASYEYDVAQESFDRLALYKRNREEVAALIGRLSSADYEVELTNGARLDWGSLGEKGRHVEAKRYRRIYVDEVGHIPDLGQTYDNILYPRTMGVGGVIHFFGTPKGYSDPYLLEIYERGKNGGDGFYFSQSGSVLENQYWTEDERERVLKNPRYVHGWVPCPNPGDCDYGICRDWKHPKLTPIGRQVLLGEFVMAGGLFFNRHHINRIFTWDESTMGQVNWIGEDYFDIPIGLDVATQQPIYSAKGRLYHAAFDLGGNKPRTKRKPGSDPTVGFVIDYTEKPWKIVRFDYIPGGSADWEDKYAIMQQVYERYQLPYLTVDATGQTDSIVEALYNRGVEVEGVHFGGTGNKKFDMLRNVQLALELCWGAEHTQGALRSPMIERLKHELEHYRLPDEDIQQDCVMALAMVLHQIVQNEIPESVSGEVY